MIFTGLDLQESRAYEAGHLLRKAAYLTTPNGLVDQPNMDLDANNAKPGAEKRYAYRDLTDAVRTARAAERLFRMSKALIIAQKTKIKQHVPDDEVGEDDLPQGKMKFDELPGPNCLGDGGAGRVIVTTPLNTGSRMLPNNILGTEITRVLTDAMLEAKRQAGEKGDPDNMPQENRKVPRAKKA